MKIENKVTLKDGRTGIVIGQRFNLWAIRLSDDSVVIILDDEVKSYTDAKGLVRMIFYQR